MVCYYIEKFNASVIDVKSRDCVSGQELTLTLAAHQIGSEIKYEVSLLKEPGAKLPGFVATRMLSADDYSKMNGFSSWTKNFPAVDFKDVPKLFTRSTQAVAQSERAFATAHVIGNDLILTFNSEDGNIMLEMQVLAPSPVAFLCEKLREILTQGTQEQPSNAPEAPTHAAEMTTSWEAQEMNRKFNGQQPPTFDQTLSQSHGSVDLTKLHDVSLDNKQYSRMPPQTSTYTGFASQPMSPYQNSVGQPHQPLVPPPPVSSTQFNNPFGYGPRLASTHSRPPIAPAYSTSSSQAPMYSSMAQNQAPPQAYNGSQPAHQLPTYPNPSYN